MADPQNENILEFGAKGVDNVARGLEKTEKGLRGLDNTLKQIKKTGSATENVVGKKRDQEEGLKNLKKLQEELVKQEKILQQTQKALKSARDVDTLAKMKREGEQATATIAKLTAQVEALSKAEATAGEQNLSKGATRRVLGTIISSAVGSGTFSGGGFGGPSVGGGLANALGLDKATQNSVKQFGETIQATVPFLTDAREEFGTMGNALKGMVRGTVTAKEGFGSLGTALGSVTVIGALAGATFAVWGKVFEMVAQKSQEARDQVDAETDALRRQIQLKQEAASFVQSGDQEAAQAQIDQAAQAMQAEQAVIDGLNQQLQAVQQEIATSQTSASLLDRLKNEPGMFSRQDEIKKNITDAENAMYQASTEWRQLTESLPDVERVRKQKEAADRLKDAEQDLIQTRQSAADAAKQFEAQLRQMAQENAVQQSRETQDRFIADSRAQADFNDQQRNTAAEGNKALESLEKEHTKTMLDLQTQYNKDSENAAIQLAKTLLSIDTSLTKSINQATKQYQQDEAKANAAFQKEQARAEAEYQKERKRRLEDAQDALLNAEMSNDVLAFLQAKESAQKDLSRMAEDRADSRQQAQEDFQQQREEAKQAFEQQIQDMKDQAAEQRQQAIESYNEEKAQRDQQYADQKAQEQLAFDERMQQQREQTQQTLDDQAAAYAKQQELQQQDRDLADQRRKEDAARQLQQMTDNLNEQLDAASKHETDLLGVINSGGTQQLAAVTLAQTQLVDAYRQGAMNAVAAVQQAMAATSTPTYTGSTTIPGATGSTTPASSNSAMTFGRSTVGAAKGIVTTRPTRVMTSENNQPEIVMPLTPSAGLPQGMFKGHTVNFGDISIGNGMPQDEVMAKLDAIAEAVIESLGEARRPS